MDHWWQSCLLSPLQECPCGLGLAQPGPVALEEPSADGVRWYKPPRWKEVVLCGWALTVVGGLVAGLGWARGSSLAPGEVGAEVGQQRCLTGSVFPTGGLRVLPHGPAVHRAAHGEAEVGVI